MLRPFTLLTTLAAALALALGAAPAHAAPGSAEAFARVLERAEARVAKDAKGLADRAQAGIRPCVTTMEKVGKGTVADDDVTLGVVALMMHATFEELLFKPMLPELARISQELDAIPTNDPVLRTGRAVWRKTYDALLRVPRVPDACARLERWRVAGFTAAARPEIPKLEVLDLVFPEDDTKRDDAKLARTVRRLRGLGISAPRAQRFDGEQLFGPLEKELDDVDFDDPSRW